MNIMMTEVEVYGGAGPARARYWWTAKLVYDGEAEVHLEKETDDCLTEADAITHAKLWAKRMGAEWDGPT